MIGDPMKSCDVTAKNNDVILLRERRAFLPMRNNFAVHQLNQNPKCWWRMGEEYHGVYHGRGMDER